MPFDLEQLYRAKAPAREDTAGPPRTAILLPSGCLFSASHPNSMETVVRTLAGALDHQNIRIFCCEGATDHDAPGVEVLPAGSRHRRVLLEKLRAFDPQVVEHHQQAKRAFAMAAALPEAAHLLYRHSALKAPRTRFDAWRYHRRYARMNGFVFVSAAEQALFTAHYPRLADRAWAVPNPIDAGPWLSSPEYREPVIAFAGRAMQEKGVDVICAALPAILDRYPDWRAVLMLNDWEHHKHWAARHVETLDRFGERALVLRSAPLSEVRHQMKSAAIALTPSIWDEPFGLAAVEAHAAGAALISSGRGGLRDVVQDVWLKIRNAEGPIASPQAYLLRMVYTAVLDRRRGTRRAAARDAAWSNPAHLADGETETADAERRLIAIQALREVEARLTALGDPAAAIFRRHRIDGLTQKRIAVEFGMGLSTVEKHLRRAYALLLDLQGDQS